MEIKTLKKGAILFREGDRADCMYDVFSGSVGVYTRYGTPEQTLLKTYNADMSFGEMGLLDHAPRSATAVALASGTKVAVVTEECFGEWFNEKPSRVLMVMQQMSANLRERSKAYVDVCREIQELSAKEEQK